MQRATGAGCQPCFEGSLLYGVFFFSKSNLGATCARAALSVPLERNSIITEAGSRLIGRRGAFICVTVAEERGQLMHSAIHEKTVIRVKTGLMHLNRVTNISTSRGGTYLCKMGWWAESHFLLRMWFQLWGNRLAGEGLTGSRSRRCGATILRAASVV